MRIALTGYCLPSTHLPLYLVTALAMSMLILGHALAQEMDHPETVVEAQLNFLRSGTKCERRRAVVTLHKLGKAAIPTLLSHIGDTDRATASVLLLQNPLLSSILPDSQHDEFNGIMSAYVIELILGQKSLVSEAVGCGFRGETSGVFLLEHHDYVYAHGLIRKSANGGILKGDLASIQEIYRKWWTANQEKTLEEMREDWNHAKRPLTGSIYFWF